MIPKIGEYYHFWDDGKTSASRHYICKCERIIKCKEAKSIILKIPNYNIDTFADKSLYNIWKDEVAYCDWLYAPETDYFIECSCPNYDENNLWFVRTKYGGWFSLNIQSWWQGGTLDVDSSIYNNIIECSIDEGWDFTAYQNEKYEKE